MNIDGLSGNKSTRKFNTKPDPEITVSDTIPADKQVVKRIIRLSGTTHSGYDFSTLTKYDPLRLVLDPMGIRTQLHDDKSAIAVFDQSGAHIAYLPRAQAKHIYPLIENNTITPEAVIYDITGGGDYHWGVQIHVKLETWCESLGLTLYGNYYEL
jgi:hypothetical protein